MALFTNKQLAELQEENERLKSINQELLLKNMGIENNPNSVAEFNSMKNQLERVKRRNDELNIQIGELKESIREKQIYLDNSISHYAHNKIIAELQQQIDDLKSTKINICPKPIHNERGAGRKSRVTPQALDLIQSLANSGLSHKAIAEKLTDETGKRWSKSTIGYLIRHSKHTDSLTPEGVVSRIIRK